MEHLEDVSVDALQAALEATEGRTPALRLVAAIAYKHGVTQSELADWFDVERKTIYNWLRRIDRDDLEEAVRDRQRPGRPPKLTADDRDTLSSILRDDPTPWSVREVSELIAERFDVEYAASSCRRILHELGYHYRRDVGGWVLAEDH